MVTVVETPEPFLKPALLGLMEMEKSPTFTVIVVEWDTTPL